jgi:hypothetical protein
MPALDAARGKARAARPPGCRRHSVADSACGGELAGFAIPGRRQAGTGEDAERGKDAQVFFVSIFGFLDHYRGCPPPEMLTPTKAAGAAAGRFRSGGFPRIV